MHFVASLLRLVLLQCKMHNTMHNISSIFLTREHRFLLGPSPLLWREHRWEQVEAVFLIYWKGYCCFIW
uniref:Uncharacterized protein n=1 Tax=Arundo donax TaxID=35708 RepID=A0A0A9E7J1_ARUDO